MVLCDDLHLPPEIQREILTRASVKTILRCRSVCKSWYSLISCLNFISDYSTRNPNKNGNRVLLGLQSYEPYAWSYCSLDEASMEFCKHDVIRDRSYPSILGSCNGLICLTGSHSTGHTTFIWNPTIRKIIELPPRTSRRGTQHLFYSGFGFDSKTNDYKVLRVVHNYNHKTDFSSYDVMCEIFYLSKGVWRVICPQVPPSSDNHYVPECYLDGAVHWSDRGVVLSFSFNDECFREMKMPDYEKLSRNHGIENMILTTCAAFNGIIHVIMCSIRDGCSIWTMKEYGVTESWTKTLNVDLKRTDDPFPRFMLLWKNDEVLMVREHWEQISDICRKNNDELVSYIPESDEFKSIFLFLSGFVSSMCLYEESLVLM